MPRWWRGTRERKRAALGKQPTSEDFAPEAVQRSVLLATLQHPATIFPWAAGILAGVWSALFGLSPRSLAVMIAGACAGLAAWVVNYVMRGEVFARRHVEELRALRDQHEIVRIEDVEDQCYRVGFEDGAKEARELREAYRGLRSFLNGQWAAGANASAEQFGVLAGETYNEGVQILARALQLHVALRTINVDALRRELAAWERELRQYGARLSGGQREALEQRIAAHRQTIDRYHQQQDQLARLLSEANALETALHTAQLEVTDLLTSSSTQLASDNTASNRLSTAIEAARRVEQRLRNLEGIQESDEEYLQAGREAAGRTHDKERSHDGR